MEQENVNTEIEIDKTDMVDENMADEQQEVLKQEVLKQEVREAPEVSDPYGQSRDQQEWTNGQVSHLERQLLLNNNVVADNSFLGNWSKVILSALAVFIPGIGQIIGIIIGLVFVSNDINSDKRSFGAALLTVSIIVFVITVIFWFLFAVAFGPLLYY